MLPVPIDELRAADENTAFLLFAWDELFSTETPDSYQPKLFHIPALVDEIEHISTRADRSNKWERHVVKIQEELKSAWELEQSLLENMPRYRGALKQLTEKGTHSEIASMARGLKSSEQKYESCAIEVLKKAVDRLPIEKRATLDAICRLATIAIRRGRSADDFIELFQLVRFKEKPQTMIDRMVGLCEPMNRDFQCVLGVRGNTEELRVIGRKAGFEVLSERRFPGGANGEKFRYQIRESIGLACKVSASKPIEAAQAAIRKLRPAMDIFNFYRHGELSFDDDVLVIEAEEKSTIVKPQQTWYWQMRKRKDATKLTKELIDQLGEERFSGRILNALEHYSLAQTSAAPRIRLVNLWSALECLTTGDNTESVINSVCSAVVPIVTWRRTSKILSYTSKTLLEFQSEYGGRFGAGFPQTERGLSNERLLLALAKPEGHPHCEELLKCVKDHPFLRFRIFSLWQSFNDPRRLAKELTLSAKRVEWHLYRIYRARNLIVHEGEELAHTSRLLENLHYYVSVTLSRILHTMKSGPNWTVFDCIVYWKARYNYIMDALEKGRADLLEAGDFQPVPSVFKNERIWTQSGNSQ